MPDPVFCLMGPTASGKTALACELVKRFPFEIISVDSAMIYRGMNIGTAKPDDSILQRAPHHLIDILDPSESYSAARFCSDTRQLCSEIIQRGRIPLLVGGTMMYFHALQQGMALLPEASTELRDSLLADAAKNGWPAMHARLNELDPVAAEKIHPHDAQRIGRALEVFYLTGKPMSSSLTRVVDESDYTFVNLLLMPESRAWLHERIEQRLDTMLAQGFLEEVEHLCANWVMPPNCPAMRCVGYRQALDYLAGDETYDNFRAKALAATRQLAKRQLTWLRHWPDGFVFACDKTSCENEIMAKVGEILDNMRLSQGDTV